MSGLLTWSNYAQYVPSWFMSFDERFNALDNIKLINVIQWDSMRCNIKLINVIQWASMCYDVRLINVTQWDLVLYNVKLTNVIQLDSMCYNIKLISVIQWDSMCKNVRFNQCHPMRFNNDRYIMIIILIITILYFMRVNSVRYTNFPWDSQIAQ